jgi:hypothetical protein
MAALIYLIDGIQWKWGMVASRSILAWALDWS